MYGLKSSGAAYRSFFAQSLRDLGYESCLADADVWRIPAVKKDGSEYYEYILTYVDDCLVISTDPDKIINALRDDYEYKMKDVQEPKRYLGATVGKYELYDNSPCWFMSAEQYLENAIKEVERKWGNLYKLFKKGMIETPCRTKYKPELDDTPFLDDDNHQIYQSYIGILRWAVELGRVDLCHAVGTMARFSAAPRKGHLVNVLRIITYAKKYRESKLVFDHLKKDFSTIPWTSKDWGDFYPDVGREVQPPGAPKPRGKVGTGEHVL